MANRQAGVLRQIRQLYSLGALGGTTDARLLAQFLAGEDAGAEIAFEALVERHGPMVFDVCRRVLRDEHAAEDAFQATFLVLARKAGSLWVKDSLGSWLHGVAHRVACRARSDTLRRRWHERQAAQRSDTPAIDYGIADVYRSDAEDVLSEEIARLPEKYRGPTVLCYLESMSYEAAASLLGLTETTVRGRLARARQRLRSRLTRRGVELPIALVGPGPAIRTGWCLGPKLLQSTIQAVMSRSAPKVVDSWPISATAVSLSERVCTTMIRTKVCVAALTLALGAITAGAIVSAQSAGGPQGEPERQTAGRGQLADHFGSFDLFDRFSGTGAGEQHRLAAGTGSEGNLIVDWTPARPAAEKVEIKVDAVRHCVHLSAVSMKRGSRPNDGAVRLDLARGKTYQVAVAGEAFMGPATGSDADPFPGVVLVYGTDEEDGFAVRQSVVAPGKSITFTSPWAIRPDDEVFLMAFFLDIWGDSKSNRGSYTLTVTEAGNQTTGYFRGVKRSTFFERSPEPAPGGGSEGSSQQVQGPKRQNGGVKGERSFFNVDQQSSAGSKSSQRGKSEGDSSNSSGAKQGQRSQSQSGSQGKRSSAGGDQQSSAKSDSTSNGKSEGNSSGSSGGKRGQSSQSQNGAQGKGSSSDGDQQSPGETGSSSKGKSERDSSNSSGANPRDGSSAQSGGSGGKSTGRDRGKPGSSGSDWGSQDKSSGQNPGHDRQGDTKRSEKSGDNGAGSQGDREEVGRPRAIRDAEFEKTLKQAEYYERVLKAATAEYEYYRGKLKRSKPKDSESRSDDSKP